MDLKWFDPSVAFLFLSAVLAAAVLGWLTAAMRARRQTTRPSRDALPSDSPRTSLEEAHGTVTNGASSEGKLPIRPNGSIVEGRLVAERLALETALRRSCLFVAAVTSAVFVLFSCFGSPMMDVGWRAGGRLETRAALRVVARVAPPPERSSLPGGDGGCEGSRRKWNRRGRASSDLIGAYGNPGGVPAWVPIDGVMPDLDDGRGRGHSPNGRGRGRAAALFRQGLLLRYGFNAVEARRNFAAAASEEWDCAMCAWGVAASLMPDVNNWRTTPATREAGRAASRVAARIAARKGPTLMRAKERGLVRAVAAFFSQPSRDDGTASESEAVFFPDEESEEAQLAAHARYLAAMERVAEETRLPGGEDGRRAIRDDPDVLALLAEAHMNLTPWRYWATHGDGRGDGTRDVRVAEGAHTEAALDALERALRAEPSHPLAAHLMVHLTEALPTVDHAEGGDVALESFRTDEEAFLYEALSNASDARNERRSRASRRRGRQLTAGLGSAAADALLGLSAVAGQSPHLVHMAAHNYVRVGRWRDAQAASEAAVDADSALSENCLAPYGADHNAAMLVAAAAMDGNESAALRHAMVRSKPHARRRKRRIHFHLCLLESSAPVGITRTLWNRARRGPYASDLGRTHPWSALDDYANVTTGFYPPPKMLMSARFGRWRDVRVAAERAETNATADVTADVAAEGVDGPISAEGWTAAVSNSAWGRAVWAYVAGLASAAEWGEKGTAGGSAVVRVSASDWLEHLRRLASEEVPEEDPHAVVPGLTARGGNPFARSSPFWPAKQRLAAIMAHTLAARVALTHSGSTQSGPRTVGSRDWRGAVNELELAVAVYDELPYFEPEHWYLPVRHCLGEALLRSGNPSRAAEVFRKDLADGHPRNPWALGGLKRAEAAMAAEAAKTESSAALEAVEAETACHEIVS